MCLTVPGKICKIDKNGFEIDYNSRKVLIANSMINNIRLGDWVLVQNRFIVQKITKQQANDFFKLIK